MPDLQSRKIWTPSYLCQEITKVPFNEVKVRRQLKGSNCNPSQFVKASQAPALPRNMVTIRHVDLRGPSCQSSEPTFAQPISEKFSSGAYFVGCIPPPA